MLSYAASLTITAGLPIPAYRSLIVQQPFLDFVDTPLPQSCVWERLDDNLKTVVIEAFAQLIVKAASAAKTPEENND
jgi:hypothetical protein